MKSNFSLFNFVIFRIKYEILNTIIIIFILFVVVAGERAGAGPAKMGSPGTAKRGDSGRAGSVALVIGLRHK